ncbi:hypothetical protein OCAR_7279 [Afipia carboxidovorans OM5]|nr:hypothetical protein OCAR_7279 [Afipia carboxidovorans OM5]
MERERETGKQKCRAIAALLGECSLWPAGSAPLLHFDNGRAAPRAGAI